VELLLLVSKKPSANLPLLETSVSSPASEPPRESVSVAAERVGVCSCSREKMTPQRTARRCMTGGSVSEDDRDINGRTGQVCLLLSCTMQGTRSAFFYRNPGNPSPSTSHFFFYPGMVRMEMEVRRSIITATCSSKLHDFTSKGKESNYKINQFYIFPTNVRMLPEANEDIDVNQCNQAIHILHTNGSTYEVKTHHRHRLL
jgi:hypothetical protein